MITIKLKYSNLSCIPCKTESGDWIDLRTEKDEKLTRGEYREISLGVAMQLPDGYEALVIPRSSTFKRYGIIQTNSIGLIDNSYCGDSDIWKFPAYATRDATIPKGTRICQFRIQKKMSNVRFLSVNTLNNKSRGGFGSTGE